MKRRILAAGIYHETHSFVPHRTTASQFTIRRGNALLDRRGDGSTYDGFFDVAGTECWEVVPGVDYTALPSGVVVHAVFEQFWSDLRDGIDGALRRGGLDGVWLSLHGAMLTDKCLDAEGELLSRLRRTPGLEAAPIFGVLDLHATFTDAMARLSNGLVAYRENPHTDARNAAARSARLLARSLSSGVAPRTSSRAAPVIWPPTGTATAERPMRDLLAMAREIEASRSDVWAANVFAGFAFSDTPDAGVSFSFIADSDAPTGAFLDQLVEAAIRLSDLGYPKEWPLDEAVARISSESRRPVLIVEPADNIGGGTAGDGTAVLDAFLRHRVSNAAVIIADADAVKGLEGVRFGESRRISIGGWSGSIGASPVVVDATLISRSDGRFALEDVRSHLAASQGIHFDMGPCCVVQVEGVRILLTSRKAPPFDLGQLRSQGIVPESLAAIGVKAAVAHRRAYDSIAGASYTVSTLGPCASDLQQLPRQHPPHSATKRPDASQSCHTRLAP